MQTEGTDPLEGLLAASTRRSRRRITSLIALGIITAALGVVTGLWNLQATNQKRKADEQLANAKEQLRQAQLAAERSNAEQQRVATLLANGAEEAHLGHYDIAAKSYDTVLDIDPHNAVALQLKGYLELREGKVSDAVSLLRDAVSINPSDPWGHYNLALALYHNGDSSGAIAQVQDLLKVAPEFRSTIVSDHQFDSLRRGSRMKDLLSDSYQKDRRTKKWSLSEQQR